MRTTPRSRIDVIRCERQHRAACPGVAAQPGDDEMGHGVEDLEDEIVDRIDVPPGFHGRIGARLDRIEMDAVRPEIMATQQHDNPADARSEKIREAEYRRSIHSMKVLPLFEPCHNNSCAE